MKTLFQRFGLTLVVNHACNLRCSYCYTGAKFNSPMPRQIGDVAIDRALHSLGPNGDLSIGFFGGEPLIESDRISHWISHARKTARDSESHVNFNLTTNGTIVSRDAWQIMLAGDLELAVSFDGTPQSHDLYRSDAQGNGTASQVLATLRQLLDAGKPFSVIVVVRPESLQTIPESLEFLHSLGVRQVHLSLDLWTTWTRQDGWCLEQVVEQAAALWRQWLPDFSVNWFDAKAGELACLPVSQTTSRCGFGAGEIAVAPSGRLYPCERLVGEDRPGHPMVLPGHVLQGADFLTFAPPPFNRCGACSECVLATVCDTGCRCSNFIRTGDVNRPDGLLCVVNKATSRAVANLLHENASSEIRNTNHQRERPCHVS